MQINIPRDYKDPGEYTKNRQSQKNNSEEYKNAVFLLNLIYQPTISILTKALNSNEEWLRNALEAPYHILKGVIDDLLKLRVLSNYFPYHPQLPSNFESEYYEDMYWEDQNKFEGLIAKEYRELKSPKYLIPKKIEDAALTISDIKSEVFDAKAIRKLLPTENKLYIHPDGKIEFYSTTCGYKKTQLKTTSNAYKLLILLASNPGKVFHFDEIVSCMNKARQQSDSSVEERVRSTIKEIRNRLNLPKEELFKVSYGYGLNCKIVMGKD